MKAAIRHLRRVDTVMARLIERVGELRPRLATEGTHFDAILRAIVYQQLSGKAAATILGRVHALYGGRPPTPEELAATPDETLRGAGLSRQKLSYLKDLAARAASGDVTLEALHELDDDEIIAQLTRIKGIGLWTAQMFLMFRLGRPDILPASDLGIQKAIQRAYRLRKRPSPQRIEQIGKPWRPYCTVACWYLWRSLDGAE